MQSAQIVGFMHVAIMGNWESVVREQVGKIRDCGLYEKTNMIHVIVVGDMGAMPDDIFVDEKFHVSYGGELTQFEFPTLSALKKHADTNDGLVWYIHTKGVGHKNTPAGVTDWRHYMEYFIIEKHVDCIAALQEYDCCGVEYKDYPARHFSGNFWWATCTYIRTLPNVTEMLRNPDLTSAIRRWHLQERHKAEFWLLLHSKVRLKNLFSSHAEFLLERLPKTAYKAEVATIKDNSLFRTMKKILRKHSFVIDYASVQKQGKNHPVYTNLQNFDWRQYRDFYPDLHQLQTKKEVIEHFLQNGIKERRKFFLKRFTTFSQSPPSS